MLGRRRGGGWGGGSGAGVYCCLLDPTAVAGVAMTGAAVAAKRRLACTDCSSASCSTTCPLSIAHCCSSAMYRKNAWVLLSTGCGIPIYPSSALETEDPSAPSGASALSFAARDWTTGPPSAGSWFQLPDGSGCGHSSVTMGLLAVLCAGDGPGGGGGGGITPYLGGGGGGCSRGMPRTLSKTVGWFGMLGGGLGGLGGCGGP